MQKHAARKLRYGAPDRAMVKLARQLIDRQSGDYDPADTEDRYEARLREIIQARAQGEDLPPEPEEPARDNVIDLMTALKRSLQQSTPPASANGRGGKDKNTKPVAAKAKPPGIRQRARQDSVQAETRASHRQRQ